MSSNREVPAPPVHKSPEEQREDRFRVMLAFGSALILVSALSCCCVGSALVSSTDDGHQTSRRHR
ncbi:MAG: hypothetical protein U0234_32570 [Sandaracinus sp.]